MNETALTWIVFILAFGGMIVIHELGHFIAARLVKVEVEEFGIGLPTPGAITLFTWQGTRFTLNWLPLGGFVRPKGENDPDVEGGLAAAAPWKRLFVLAAGPAMNLVTAVILFSLIISQMGGVLTLSGSDETSQEILITEVVANSPAEQGGIQVGDLLVEISGKPLTDLNDLTTLITENVDQSVVFTVNRDGSEIDLTVVPRMNEQAGRPMIGIGYRSGATFKPVSSLTENIQYSIQYTGQQIYALVTLPVRLIQGTIPAEQGRLIGFKGIFDIMEQSVSNDVEAARTNSTAATGSNPFSQPVGTLFLLASLSISLGIFNLFPFPALDGGRILFVLPELIFRRRVSPQLENLVHGLGMLVLLGLMVYVNILDFLKPVSDLFP
ncbi:MAG: M50 family metallopeptidase [Anaerolineales bacterium]|nr:M50 family metallopeptidase [Anaerolineales bacterium]